MEFRKCFKTTYNTSTHIKYSKTLVAQTAAMIDAAIVAIGAVVTASGAVVTASGAVVGVRPLPLLCVCLFLVCAYMVVCPEKTYLSSSVISV